MNKEVKNLIIWIATILVAGAILIWCILTGIQEENKKKAQAVQPQEAATAKNQFIEESDTMHNDYDASGDRVPVPNGYVGSSVAGENEIDTGYVIYEGEDPVTDTNVAEARKTRNQYVWVPVPDASKLYGTDAKGKKWGKLYDFTTDTGSNIDPVTGAKPYNWSESNGVMSLSTTSREPDVLTDYDFDSNLKQNGMGRLSMHEFQIEMEKEFTNMIKSVESYGGYYIGRYETGGLNGTAKIVKGDTNISSQTWYTVYKKMKELKGSNANVETGMIWGCQWDRTLMWLIERGSKKKEQICTDSGDWGNYRNNSIEYVNTRGSTVTTTENSDTRIPTGTSEQTKANNIYDLAGNVKEWTMEADSAYDRKLRGGSYRLSSRDYPVSSYRYYSFTSSLYTNNGGRSVLYIQ